LKKVNYLKAGELLYFASTETPKTVVVSWLVAMTIAAETVAPSAMSLSRRVHSLLILAMDA
jgi:hypothetical protein